MDKISKKAFGYLLFHLIVLIIGGVCGMSGTMVAIGLLLAIVMLVTLLATYYTNSDEYYY